MNLRIFLAALFLANLLNTLPGYSQGTTTLHIFDMPGFPDLPQDTIYEQQNYTFNLELANNTNFSIPPNGLAVYMRVDTITTPLPINVPPAMQPGDTVSLVVAANSFNQPQFKAGNNIVVVWPVVNGLIIPIDSIFANVFYVTLSSLGADEVDAPHLQLHPVPATNLLHLETVSGKSVEYVRIFDLKGRLVKEYREFENGIIDVADLNKGMYILEAIIEGSPVRRKFLRE